MLSAFRATKYRYLFNLLDINDNGLIQQNDFALLAEKLAPINGGITDQQALTKLIYRGETFFKRLVKTMKPKDPTQVNMHEWVMYIIYKEILLSEDEDNLAELAQLLLGFIFGLFDEDHDGFISKEEYEDIFHFFKIDKIKYRSIFQQLDSNADERLSRYEMTMAVETFITSDDPSGLGNWILGDYEI